MLISATSTAGDAMYVLWSWLVIMELYVRRT